MISLTKGHAKPQIQGKPIKKTKCRMFLFVETAERRVAYAIQNLRRALLMSHFNAHFFLFL